MTDVRRLIELIAVPALLLAAIALPVPLLGDELPDRIATHWDFGGEPDGSMDATVFWLGGSALWVALWGLLLWRARATTGRLVEALPILATGGFLAALSIITVLANRDAADWRAAGEVGPLQVLVALAAGAVGAAIALGCERGRAYPDAGGTTGGAPTVGLAPGERAVWVGGADAGRMRIGSAVAAAATLVVALLTGPPAAWVVLAAGLVVALALATLSSVRVTVSAAGVRVGLGPYRVLRRLVPLEQIERADAIEVEPLRWGGWGWRWAGRGRSAVVLRRGPGLELALTGGRRFAVTVDDPGQAAGLVNDLLRAR